MGESHANFISNSFGLVMADDGHNELKSRAFALYLPSYQERGIYRNEFSIYLAIGLPGDKIKPHNCEVVKFSDTNIATVLSSIHAGIPDMNTMFHPSIGAYVDIV